MLNSNCISEIWHISNLKKHYCSERHTKNDFLKKFILNFQKIEPPKFHVPNYSFYFDKITFITWVSSENQLLMLKIITLLGFYNQKFQYKRINSWVMRWNIANIARSFAHGHLFNWITTNVFRLQSRHKSPHIGTASCLMINILSILVWWVRAVHVRKNRATKSVAELCTVLL